MMAAPARAAMGINLAAKACRSRIDWYHTQMYSPPAIDWPAIDCVLLDMDGTLLDLRFDNWFWANVVPERYAHAKGLSVAAAQAELAPLFTKVAHTLPWYCIDHWSRELDLDIRALKRTAREQIRFLPGAEQFLEKLRLSGKRVVLG